MFDPAVPSELSRYAFVHFVLTIPAALWLLTRADVLRPVQLVAGAFYVVLSLTNIGGTLEARRWAFVSEQARLGALLVASVALLMMNGLVAGVLLLICSSSLAWLWRARSSFVVPSDERMDLHLAK
ncbi:hypothetical protein [Gemmatimonas sp.]|uniref:hypothetical protein n=1 Tax=Gemmatimonas sp. TaxID=1962908 RepID=UPI003341990E